MLVIVTVASYSPEAAGWKSCLTRRSLPWTFTTETAEESVAVKLSSDMFWVGAESVASAEPFTPEPGSATPQPSHTHPLAKASLPVASKRSPTGPDVPSGRLACATPRYPSGFTAKSTLPLSIHAAGKHARSRDVASVSLLL